MTSERVNLEAAANDLLARLQTLNLDLEATLDRAQAARERLSDPEWMARIRERTRQEATNDLDLMAGTAAVFGA